MKTMKDSNGEVYLPAKEFYKHYIIMHFRCAVQYDAKTFDEIKERLLHEFLESEFFKECDDKFIREVSMLIRTSYENMKEFDASVQRQRYGIYADIDINDEEEVARVEAEEEARQKAEAKAKEENPEEESEEFPKLKLVK